MTLSLSSTGRRGLLLALAFAVAVALAYFSIRSAFAEYYSELDTLQGYERATRLEPSEFRYWYLLGRYWQFNLVDADASRAIRAYTTALALNPHDAEIWSDLATAYESEGDIAAARDAFLHAKRAYPLSAEVSWRYGNFLLRQGELDAAFLEIRHAVEADPKRAAEALSRALRAEPNIDLLLDRVLPPDSTVYLNAIWEQTNEGYTENAFKIWQRLASLHPHVQLVDCFALVGALRRDKRFLDARQVWDQALTLSGLADLPEPAGSILWDGGFESGVIGGGFAWTFPVGIRGVQISIDPHEKHSGSHSLQLFFNGKFNLQLIGPCHDVPVEPSTTYRFSAWVRTQSLSTDQGIRFQLRPWAAQDASTAVTSDLRGTQPWTLLETSWSSGKDTHEMQVCAVRYPSQEADSKIQGIAWLDDVAVMPAALEPAKP
jgi:cytochrome c-type biogenesis protein CcmH/NrfG